MSQVDSRKRYPSKMISVNENGPSESGLSIVIPCFQSELTLHEVVRGIYNVQSDLDDREFEILLVIDGATDGTLEVANELQQEFKEVHVVELTRNFGQHAAIFAGIRYSKFSLVLTMDDDGQHQAESVLALQNAMNNNVDIVYGIAITEEHGLFRSFASRSLKTALFHFLGANNAKDISALRLFRKSLLENIDLDNLAVGVIDVALQWNTTRIMAVPVRMLKRSKGASNYKIADLVRFAISMAVNYSVKPLKIALMMGLITLMISFSLTIFFIIQYLNGNTSVAGFSTITILVTSLASVQLMTLGILGEYVGRIHQKTIGKPHFTVRKR
jgi:glycosyltransferase involved in cell wall biosynthesis